MIVKELKTFHGRREGTAKIGETCEVLFVSETYSCLLPSPLFHITALDKTKLLLQAK